jgi:hypothetical protein
MQQNVVAGKTPVGTKVQAKLAVATLVHGVVIPQDAILSGEVTESAAKSTESSRLALRMDSAQWKSGASATVLPLNPKVYLTGWYYPPAMAQNSSGAILDAAHNPNDRAAIYPGASSATARPLPGSDQDTSRNIPEPSSGPSSSISNHRVQIKNVESTSDAEGAVTLTSKHSNIKLDKSTTYVFASGGWASSPSSHSP